MLHFFRVKSGFPGLDLLSSRSNRAAVGTLCLKIKENLTELETLTWGKKGSLSSPSWLFPTRNDTGGIFPFLAAPYSQNATCGIAKKMEIPPPMLFQVTKRSNSPSSLHVRLLTSTDFSFLLNKQPLQLLYGGRKSVWSQGTWKNVIWLCHVWTGIPEPIPLDNIHYQHTVSSYLLPVCLSHLAVLPKNPFGRAPEKPQGSTRHEDLLLVGTAHFVFSISPSQVIIATDASPTVPTTHMYHCMWSPLLRILKKGSCKPSPLWIKSTQTTSIWCGQCVCPCENNYLWFSFSAP